MDHFPEKQKALIIEDSSFQRNMLSIICTEAGFLTVLVENGLQALEAIGEMDFSLIITDLEMPKMDGLQLIGELAKCNVDAQIIFVSGHGESVLIAAQALAKESGLNIAGIINKPYMPEDVLRLLKEKCLTSTSQSANPKFEKQFQGKLSPNAIARGIKDGAIIPYYQPQVCHQNKSLLGFECLARWKTTSGAILSPVSFIPIAEEHGMMKELSDVILQRAFEDMSHWFKKGRCLPISVNISMDNLEDIEFPDRLMELTNAYDVPPSAITLEVTETKVMDDARDCLEVMSRLRIRGFGMAIDDFGTGFASLKQLQHFPFTELKLDRSYVAAAVDHARSRTVLESGLQLAENLGLSCIAEGVETTQQANLLMSMGCTQHQGFLYAKPMPCKDVLPWTQSLFRGIEPEDKTRDIFDLSEGSENNLQQHPKGYVVRETNQSPR